MRAEDGARPRGHFIQFLDENGSGGTQFFHDVFVVDDFLADIDRRAVEVERNFHDIDSPDDTGAETARLEQKNLILRAVIRCERL